MIRKESHCSISPFRRVLISQQRHPFNCTEVTHRGNRCVASDRRHNTHVHIVLPVTKPQDQYSQNATDDLLYLMHHHCHALQQYGQPRLVQLHRLPMRSPLSHELVQLLRSHRQLSINDRCLNEIVFDPNDTRKCPLVCAQLRA